MNSATHSLRRTPRDVSILTTQILRSFRSTTGDIICASFFIQAVVHDSQTSGYKLAVINVSLEVENKDIFVPLIVDH